MSKALGIGVLAVGVGVLGWWGSTHNAHRMENFIRDHAEEVARASIHGAQATVSGRDILLSGIMDGPEEEASLLAALDAVPGRRIVTEDVKVLEKVTPFTLDVTKDTAISAAGYVPTEAVRGALGLGDADAGLTLASGAPSGWAELAAKGISALAPMVKGKMSLADSAMKISGTVLGPDEAAAVDAALAGLPAGSVTKDIAMLDDGTPASYGLEYSAATGATASGKLPKGVDLAAIAGALGLSNIAGRVTQGLLGADGSVAGLDVFKDWMGKIEAMKLSVTPEATKADVQVAAGVDTDALTAALSGAGIAPTVTVATASGTNGDKRVNAATGEDQRFMGGFWLNVPKVDLSLAGCQSAAESVLSRDTINFVSGSDELDASAVAVINTLASIMARCSEEAGLKAEIGGYTDNSGDAVANLGLSQRRATAVRRELITRGVAAGSLKALGHGDADPIADNATEEGRAKNRRTTITWSE